MKRILVLTTALVLLAAACNKQAAVQPDQNQTSQNQETQSTANWKTYTNAKYGYEISYNNNWRLEKTSDEMVAIYFNIEGGEGQPIIIKVTSDSQATVENQIKGELTDLTRSSYSSKQTQFAGVSAKEISFGTEVGGTINEFLIPQNGKLMIISYMDGSGEIINTFKFTNSQTNQTTKVTPPPPATTPAESGITGVINMTTCGGAAPATGQSTCNNWVGAVYAQITSSDGTSQYFTTKSDGTFKVALKPGKYTITAGGTTSENNTVTVVSGKYATINPHFTILAP